jgi:hypothetical protein
MRNKKLDDNGAATPASLPGKLRGLRPRLEKKERFSLTEKPQYVQIKLKGTK